MSKSNKKKNIKEAQKSLSTNLLAVGGLLAIDCISVMVQSTIKINANPENVVAQQVLYYGIVSYLVLFMLGFFCFRAIEKKKKKDIQKYFLIMIIICLFNILTFIMGGYVFSLITLIPVAMMIYLRELTKRELY